MSCVICGEPEEIGAPHVTATCALNLRGKLAAAEARIRGLEEALRNAVEMIHDASGPLEYARANDWMRGQLRSLTPPPEAEKRGEG